MAAPVDAGRATTSISSAANPWTVNLPGGIVAGHLLLMYVRSGGAQSFTTPSGWSKDGNIGDFSSDAADDLNSVFWRVADGTEGATLSLDVSASAKGAAIVWRITGAADPATQPPESNFPQTGTGANIDPNVSIPTGGPKDFLYVVCGGCDGETQTFSNSDLSNVTNANSGTGGAVATNCRIGGGTIEQSSSSSYNPAAWTVAAPQSGVTAFVVAVHPSAGGANTYTKAGFGKEHG